MDINGIGNLERKYVNYKNLFNNDAFIDGFLNEVQNVISKDEINYPSYNDVDFISFKKFDTAENDGIQVDVVTDTYLTVNNGYSVYFNYYRTNNTPVACNLDFNAVIQSVIATSEVEEMPSYNYSDSELIYKFLIPIGLTFISYEIVPFILIVLMKKKYNEKELKKMALINSLVIGFIFCIYTLSLNENVTWNAAPATLYYFINIHFWKIKNNQKPKINSSNKTKDKDLEDMIVELDKKINYKYKCSNCGVFLNEKDTICPKCGEKFLDINEKNKEDVYECSNCGKDVKDSDKKCPYCGEIFEEDEIGNDYDIKSKSIDEPNIDKKYSDLKKLKRLLDENIITQEEFENEKKKILK